MTEADRKPEGKPTQNPYDAPHSYISSLLYAALPYLNPELHGLLWVFTSLFDLIEALGRLPNGIRLDGITPQRAILDGEGLLGALRPVCRPKERQIVDTLNTAFAAKRAFELYQMFSAFMPKDAPPQADAAAAGSSGMPFSGMEGMDMAALFQMLSGMGGFGTPAPSQEPPHADSAAASQAVPYADSAAVPAQAAPFADSAAVPAQAAPFADSAAVPAQAAPFADLSHAAAVTIGTESEAQKAAATSRLSTVVPFPQTPTIPWSNPNAAPTSADDSPSVASFPQAADYKPPHGHTTTSPSPDGKPQYEHALASPTPDGKPQHGHTPASPKPDGKPQHGHTPASPTPDGKPQHEHTPISPTSDGKPQHNQSPVAPEPAAPAHASSQGADDKALQSLEALLTPEQRTTYALMKQLLDTGTSEQRMT